MKKMTKGEALAKAGVAARNRVKELIAGTTGITEEKRKAKDAFIEKYTKCEMIYKSLYPAYRKAKDNKTIDPKKLDINVQLIEASLRWGGIQYDDEEVKRIFSADKKYKQEGNRACTLLRNIIMHTFDMGSIEEVFVRKEELLELMNSFINNAIR